MVTFIPTPIGNLEDITYRALTKLQKAQIIFCEDSRVTKRLLSLLSQKFDIKFNIENFIPLHSHNELEVLAKIDKAIFQKEVVYMSDAGMPCISDPGIELVRFCRQNLIKYEILTGANAGLVAIAGSGFDKEFLFFGFLPHKGKEREMKLNEALFSGYNTILYESPKRVEKLLNEIAEIEPTRLIYAIKEISKLHETSFLSQAQELKNSFKNINLKGEWSIVIKAGIKIRNKITLQDITPLNLPKKIKAKLIAKVTGKPIKECYDELINK